jgi:hypothetical protein
VGKQGKVESWLSLNSGDPGKQGHHHYWSATATALATTILCILRVPPRTTFFQRCSNVSLLCPKCLPRQPSISLYRTKSPLLQYPFQHTKPKIYPWALKALVAIRLLALPKLVYLLPAGYRFFGGLSDFEAAAAFNSDQRKASYYQLHPDQTPY